MWPGAAAPASSTCAGALEHHLGRREHQRRVEVALHGAAADPLDAGGQRDPPVDADDVGARRAHQVEDLAGADPEVDARDTGRADPLEHARRVRHARGARSRSRVTAPAQESNSCTAEAPASTCTSR